MADWLLPLETPQREAFRERLLELELKKNIPYVNTLQEMSLEEGLVKGRDEGRIEAMRLVIMDALEGRFVILDSEVKGVLQSISQFEDLKKAHRFAVSAKSLEEFKSNFPR